MQSKKEEENYDSDNDGDSEGDAEDEEGPKRRRQRVECIMGNRSAEELRNHHPQRITAQFKWGNRNVTLSSDFDAGNMARVEQTDCPNHFNIWMCSDSMPYYKYTGFRAYFYFAIKGVERGKNVHFHIRNMGFLRSLYSSGLRPFFRVGREGKFKRIPGKITWNNGEDGFQINFVHQITVKDIETYTYFSFIEPWGYEDTINYFSSWQEKIKNSPRMSDEVYFHRELLGYSLERRYVELITITGKNDMLDEREPKVEGPGLHPEFDDDSEEAKIFHKQRCHKFSKKKVVFFCARVHPGEVQASHVLNGIVDFVLNKSLQASIILENYVIKVIPLVNPDGVARGYYRLDTHNHNLNRFYLNPCPQQQPTVYMIKKAIVTQHKQGNLKLYIDLHGHASKKGCFIFGNNLKGEQQADNMLFAKLMALNSLNFDFQECSFSEKLMTVKDGGSGLSREGSGRVGIFKATGMVNSYTLECHYQTGRRLNTLTPKYNMDQLCIESEDQLTDRNSKFYRDQRNPNYTIEIFEDVGRAVCIAMLEWIEKNPISRIPTSHYKNLASIRNELIVHNCLLPYDVIKDLRKDVAKEREAMKARTQKLQAQIQSRKLQEEKKAARLKEKEEREARAEISEKIKNEAKETKKKKKEHASMKCKNSDTDIKKDDGKDEKGQRERSNHKTFKNNLQHMNTTKSPSDRFFVKIGNDILSPVTSAKAKTGGMPRNQMTRNSNQSQQRPQSKDSNKNPNLQMISNSQRKLFERENNHIQPVLNVKERRLDSLQQIESKRQTSNNSSLINEKASKSAKSASRKNISKNLMQNMLKTEKEQNMKYLKGSKNSRQKYQQAIMNRQKSNLSCNDKDQTAQSRDLSLNNTDQNEVQSPAFPTSSEATQATLSQGLTLFQQYVQKKNSHQENNQMPQTQKINVEFLQKMGIPVPKEGEMIIIQHNDQIHCIDRRKPENRKENLIINLQQQKKESTPLTFLIPPVQYQQQQQQQQLQEPKVQQPNQIYQGASVQAPANHSGSSTTSTSQCSKPLPKFIGGSQFGLCFEDSQTSGEKTNASPEQFKTALRSEFMSNLRVQEDHRQQRLQQISLGLQSQKLTARDPSVNNERKVLPEIMDQQQNLLMDSGNLYNKRNNNNNPVFQRGIKPLLRKMQRGQMMIRNVRFASKQPSGYSSSQQRNGDSSSGTRFGQVSNQDVITTEPSSSQSQQDRVLQRKVSNSVELNHSMTKQADENVQFLNLLEQKQKIIEQYNLQEKASSKQHHANAEIGQHIQSMSQIPSLIQGANNLQGSQIQLKPTYNLFQSNKLRQVGQARDSIQQDFSQLINRHQSPGRQIDQIPLILGQNYKKVMKFNKQHQSNMFTNIPTNGTGSLMQQQVLKSIEPVDCDFNTNLQCLNIKQQHSFDHDANQMNMFQHGKRLQEQYSGKVGTHSRMESTPDQRNSNDFKSATLVPMAANSNSSQRQTIAAKVHNNQNMYHSKNSCNTQMVNMHSSYNNFMVQGYQQEN